MCSLLWPSKYRGGKGLSGEYRAGVTPERGNASQMNNLSSQSSAISGGLGYPNDRQEQNRLEHKRLQISQVGAYEDKQHCSKEPRDNIAFDMASMHRIRRGRKAPQPLLSSTSALPFHEINDRS